MMTETELLEYSKGVELINASFDYSQCIVKIDFSIDENPDRFFDYCRRHGLTVFYQIVMRRVSEQIHLASPFASVIPLKDDNARRVFWDILNEKSPDTDNFITEIKPCETRMIAVQNGAAFVYEEVDEDVLEAARIALDNLVRKHKPEIDRRVTLIEAPLLEEMNRFKEDILSDPAFRCCTNQSKRRKYINELKRNGKYEPLWHFTFRGHNSSIAIMADSIYEKYKIKCRKNKIPLGDPLPVELITEEGQP